ncbi:MAG: glycoside hydrolase family 95 protein [Thermoguttaceae bacterium]
MKLGIVGGMLGCLFLSGSPAPADTAVNELLWYQRPGKEWNSQSIHLGNGWFGASFFGNAKQERFTLGEKTFWTGGPGDSKTNSYGVRPGGKEHIAEIRRLILAGRIPEADALWSKYMQGDHAVTLFGSLSTIGNLTLNFQNHDGAVANYRRELDLRQSVASVAYEVAGVRYRREYFCSYPARALVMRVTCDKPGALSFDVGVDPAHKKRSPTVKVTPERGLWELNGNIDDNNRPYRIKIKVLSEGGSRNAKNNRLAVKDANAATVIYTVATDYLLKPPEYRGADPEAITADVLKKLEGRSYHDLRAEHVADYQRLYLRAQFHLDGQLAERANLPTDERWKFYSKLDDADLGLRELAFNFGKYLLIAASRPKALPSGLQGAWIGDFTAPWNGNYQININIPLIYMPGNVLGLSECNEPFLDWIRALVVPGREVAKAYYGARGWVGHATGNIWGFASPGSDIEWGAFPSGAAWECRHLWEQFEFTGDRHYLRDHAYPVMKEAAQFWLENLTEYHGSLVATPAVSAEQRSPKGFLLPSMQDVVLVGDLFDNVVNASKILGVDPEFRDRVAKTRAKLTPLKIGRLGQLQEWVEDVDDPNCHHRHFMHLMAVQPCQQINPRVDKALAEAARVSMNLRGDGDNAQRLDPKYQSTKCACTHCGHPCDPWIAGNWSRSWKCWIWARLFDGDRADKIFVEMLGEAGFENLCTYQQTGGHTPMQLDGSVTAPGFIAEMLMQSQFDVIAFLPALPKKWPAGSITGIKARGNVTVNLAWNHGKATQASVRSARTRQLHLMAPRDQKIAEIATDGKAAPFATDPHGIVSFQAESDRDYHVTFR